MQEAVVVTVVMMEVTVQVLSVRVNVVVIVTLVALGVTVTRAVADGRVIVVCGVTVMFLSTYCVLVLWQQSVIYAEHCVRGTLTDVTV